MFTGLSGSQKKLLLIATLVFGVALAGGVKHVLYSHSEQVISHQPAENGVNKIVPPKQTSDNAVNTLKQTSG
jgi:hypothetical protein